MAADKMYLFLPTAIVFLLIFTNKSSSNSALLREFEISQVICRIIFIFFFDLLSQEIKINLHFLDL